MADSLVSESFRWPVPAEGYRIVEADHYRSALDLAARSAVYGFDRDDFYMEEGPPRLFIAESCPYDPLYRRVDPSEDRWLDTSERRLSGLFRSFAKSDRTPEGALRFASRYGVPVDSGEWYYIENPEESDVYSGVPYSAFAVEAYDMAVAVGLWDMLVSGELDQLGQLFSPDQYVREHWRFRPGGVFGVPPVDERPERQMDLRLPNKLVTDLPDGPQYSPLPFPIRAALALLQDMTTGHLRRGCRLGMAPRADGIGLTLRFEPTGLLGALWLQFARAFSRNKAFRECPNCGAWFELSPESGRADKLYCSVNCRTGMHQKRRSRALSMAAAGETPGRISRAVGVSLETVDRWLSKQQGGEADAKETRT